MPAVIQRRPVSDDSFQFGENIPPLLQRILSARGLGCASDIDLSLSRLLPPDKLKGIDQALALLTDALQQQWRIVIVGDFDADGATSCALAVRALNAFGHQNVQFIVPNRFEFGYGLTPEIVTLVQQLSPQLIITVDNGISSIAGVAAAKAKGIKVIVTDHHLPGAELPKADAIVNPNQPGCDFPSKNLAGVGVIFYLMAALRARLRELGWFNESLKAPNMRQFLDLVALGTVADVVPLDANNRVLVQQGINRIRQGNSNVGIQALVEISNRHCVNVTSMDIGFLIGPRLNAAGRLDDISIGIACLLTDDIEMARGIAAELDDFNKDRRLIEKSMQIQADKHMQVLAEQIHEGNAGNSPLPVGVCLFDDTWHQGVVGILASRIKERYHRPVICFAPADDNGDSDELKGSARSINGFHIRDALDAVASANPGLINKFGGHAMAAGLSLPRKAFADFASAFNRYAQMQLSEQDLQAVVWTDGDLKSDEITLENAALLRSAMPWGQKLPEPSFDGRFYIEQQRLVGTNHLKLVLKKNKADQVNIDAIAFNIDPKCWPDQTVDYIDIVYLLDVNRYRGIESLQFIVRHIEKAKIDNG
jgi:single-stranded-DNA-specific exonuclease